jgi:hypothetical protein
MQEASVPDEPPVRERGKDYRFLVIPVLVRTM